MKRNLVNTLWGSLFILSGSVALWFSLLTLQGTWDYVRLDACAPASVQKWEVIEETPSRYALLAHFCFSVGSREYEGKTLFHTPHYLNRFAAEAAIKEMESFSWQAWYAARSPGHASLQKFFPFKHLLYALLSLGVLIYFFLLRYFVFSRRR